LAPKAGEHILITGAAGSVGRAAVYTAKLHGAKVLAGVRTSQLDEARSIGADSVFALDHNEDIADLPPLDAIADTVGGETAAKVLRKLKKSGKFATVVGAPDAAKQTGVHVKQVFAQPDAARLQQLAKAYQAGELKIVIAQRMPLSDIRKAQEAAEQGAGGKIVLLP
jgi:NADPH:quinone reductase-like Zn-dependent oxidoreductase